MESGFYRSRRRQQIIREFLKRTLRNRRRSAAFILGGLFVLYLAFDNKGIVRRVNLELQRREMTEKLASAKEETRRLEAQLKALEGDKKTIEKLAREKYGMAREGETVYRVKKD